MRFTEEGPENWRVHCRCESRRRQTASTFADIADGHWRTRKAEDVFNSARLAERGSKDKASEFADRKSASAD